jgi:5'-methylthioadenosine phosphorylase
MFAKWGGDVVGMTGLPEAVFAREAGICYSGIAIVTNYGAGLTDESVDHSKVMERMGARIETVRSLILNAASFIPDKRGCRCAPSST